MPGLKSSEMPHQDYLTPFRVYRTEAGDDNEDAGAVEPVIDFTNSVTASRNEIWVKLRRTEGDGDTAVELWADLNSPDDPGYFKLAEIANAEPGKIYRFHSIYAGFCKILLKPASTGVYTVLVAHTDLKISGNLQR